ncbi:hypothetical protein GQX74_006980 [Glossina fuscipes]|nr:hypothetical protein GQX74_006980 [Glossina fuscipes]
MISGSGGSLNLLVGMTEREEYVKTDKELFFDKMKILETINTKNKNIKKKQQRSEKDHNRQFDDICIISTSIRCKRCFFVLHK